MSVLTKSMNSIKQLVLLILYIYYIFIIFWYIPSLSKVWFTVAYCTNFTVASKKLVLLYLLLLLSPAPLRPLSLFALPSSLFSLLAPLPPSPSLTGKSNSVDNYRKILSDSDLPKYMLHQRVLFLLIFCIFFCICLFFVVLVCFIWLDTICCLLVHQVAVARSKQCYRDINCKSLFYIIHFFFFFFVFL